MRLAFDRATALTGYFGVPGTSRITKVHAYGYFEIPQPEPRLRATACGKKFAGGFEFQLCASGIFAPIIDCARCRKALTLDPPEIVINRAACRSCGEILESRHVHDFRSCGCGKSFVDGGRDYLRRGGDVIEMSETRPKLQKEKP